MYIPANGLFISAFFSCTCVFVLVFHVVKSISLVMSFNNLSVFQGAFFIFAYLIIFPAGRLTDNTSQYDVIFTDDLVICSLNARGLSSITKRREIFRWLKMKAYAIYFLQEFHCTKDKETLWSSEWGYSAIFSSLSNASVGVGVLFNNNFTFQIMKSYSDPVGRFVIIDIHTENKTLNKTLLLNP